MRGFGLQLRSQGYVRKGVHETEGLFPCKSIQLSFRPIHILTIPRRLPLKRVEREHGFYPKWLSTPHFGHGEYGLFLAQF